MATETSFSSSQLKKENVKNGSTIIERKSSKTEREGTLDSGQLRCGADRSSTTDAIRRKQLRSTVELPKSEHKNDDHPFVRDNAFPRWHGWHAFRRGIATNLHQLGVADKDIQAILRHSNIGITMNIYVKSVAESQVDAMDLLGEEFDKQNRLGNSREPRTVVN